jgi:hypothetical protein
MISKPPNDFSVKQKLTGCSKQNGFFYIAPEPKAALGAPRRNPRDTNYIPSDAYESLLGSKTAYDLG